MPKAKPMNTAIVCFKCSPAEKAALVAAAAAEIRPLSQWCRMVLKKAACKKKN